MNEELMNNEVKDQEATMEVAPEAMVPVEPATDVETVPTAPEAPAQNGGNGGKLELVVGGMAVGVLVAVGVKLLFDKGKKRYMQWQNKREAKKTDKRRDELKLLAAENNEEQ